VLCTACIWRPGYFNTLFATFGVYDPALCRHFKSFGFTQAPCLSRNLKTVLFTRLWQAYQDGLLAVRRRRHHHHHQPSTSEVQRPVRGRYKRLKVLPNVFVTLFGNGEFEIGLLSGAFQEHGLCSYIRNFI
jgi:hypothetical protein